jgi:glycosyltransferase involved in cell wall biosynthesis
VHVLYLIDSLVAGGAERSLAALAPHYRRLGVRLDVAYLHERDGVGPELVAAGAQLFSLAGAGGRLAAVRRGAQLVRMRRPDVVHTTLFEADVTGRLGSMLARAPVVSSLVNAAYGPEQLANPSLARWKVRAAQALDAITARRVSRFHAVSSSVADVMAARLRIARDRIDVIPRGRDAEELGVRTDDRRALARAALGVDRDTPVVLAIGRQEYQKGFDVLLRAFAAVRSRDARARLFVAGREGNETASLRVLVEDRSLQPAVTFLGERRDVPELLCAADVFAFPTRWEGMPGTVIEAMALQVPIVASDIAPVREVLGDDAAGRLVAPDDPEQLARAIDDALHDTDRERTDAARARFLERFTIEGVADEMVRFYVRATKT